MSESSHAENTDFTRPVVSGYRVGFNDKQVATMQLMEASMQ